MLGTQDSTASLIPNVVPPPVQDGSAGSDHDTDSDGERERQRMLIDPKAQQASIDIQAVFRGFLCRIRLAADEVVLPPDHVIKQLDRHRRERRGFCALCVFFCFSLVFLFVMSARVSAPNRFSFEVQHSVCTAASILTVSRFQPLSARPGGPAGVCQF